MKKRLIDQNKRDVISVNGNHDDFPQEKEVSNHDNSINHPDEASINNFSIDEEEDDETMLFHNIAHEDNDHHDLNSCVDHDEQQEYQLSTQQRRHVATVTPRKKENITNFGGILESSIDPGSRSFSKLNGKASYKDLLNVIREKDKLIGKLQSENEGKDFIELNAIQEKSVVEVTKKYLFPYCQFIRNADVLDRFESSNSIGKMIMDRVGVKDNIRSNFWYTYKHIVRKAIKQQRNISHNAIRCVFISK